MRKRKNSGFNSLSGFTLIELLVAMTIIAILAALSLVSFQGSRKSARDGKRKSDLEQIRAALEMYRADDDGAYPDDLSDLGDYLDARVDPVSGLDYSFNLVSTSEYNLCAQLEIATGDTYTSTECGGDCNGDGCNYKVTNP